MNRNGDSIRDLLGYPPPEQLAPYPRPCPCTVAASTLHSLQIQFLTKPLSALTVSIDPSSVFASVVVLERNQNKIGHISIGHSVCVSNTERMLYQRRGIKRHTCNLILTTSRGAMTKRDTTPAEAPQRTVSVLDRVGVPSAMLAR